MTREEKRKDAAIEACFAEWHNCNNAIVESYIAGAEWADNHPDEKVIAQYLYEKKGYPIDLNGHLPSFEDTMKDVELYDRYKREKWMDRACEWISDNIRYYTHNDPLYEEYIDEERFINDFRKSMKESK